MSTRDQDQRNPQNPKEKAASSPGKQQQGQMPGPKGEQQQGGQKHESTRDERRDQR